FTVILMIFNDQIVGFVKSVDLGFQVSFFQIFFNISTALIALIFIKQLEKLSYMLVKNKETTKEDKTLKFVNESLLKTPSFALAALDKEVLRMFDLTKENMFFAFKSIEDGIAYEFKKVVDNEEVIDYLNSAIALYLVKLSSERLNYNAELQIGKIYHVINDLERIADHAHNFLLLINEMSAENIAFSGVAQEELKTFMNDLKLMVELTENIYIKNQIKELKKLSHLEELIDKHKLEYEKNHVIRLRIGE